MSKENYEALLPSIEAITDADAKTPNMPIDTYLQEAADLEVWSKEDKAQLRKVGIAATTFESLPTKIGALRYAQSLWMKERYTKEEATKEWEQKQPEANELRDDLQAAFDFAFRKQADLLAKVSAIREGSGNADLVQDLSDLSVLGKANQPLLKAIGFEMELLDKAASFTTEMSVLLAAMNGERTEGNTDKKIRDKAYTYLKLTVDEIREAGKYVFRKDENRLRGYSSAYFRKK